MTVHNYDMHLEAKEGCPYLVMAFDPGLTTGVAWFNRDYGTVASEEWDLDRIYDWVGHSFYSASRGVIVCESFIISNATIRKSQATWSLELIGLLRLPARRTELGELQLQSPSAAKSFITDVKLKHLGLWPSSDHERDALRHLLLWLARMGYLDISVFDGVQAPSS